MPVLTGVVASAHVVPAATTVMGYDTIAANHAAAGTYRPQCFVHNSLTYVAVTGDVMTEVAVYHDDTTTGTVHVGVYAIVAGVPTTQVGSDVVFSVPATVGWITQSCSIPLVAGERYGISMLTFPNPPAVGAWGFRYGDGAMGAAMSVHDDASPIANLPSTWVVYGTDTNVLSFYATVTHGGGSPVVLVEDDWTGTNGDPWDEDIWISAAARVGNFTIQSNTGQLSAASHIISEMSVTDFELVVKVHWSTLAGQYIEIGWRMHSGLSGGPHGGYGIQILGGGGTSGGIQMFRINDYYDLTGVVDDPIFYTTGAGTVWVKVRAVGTSHKVRWWEDGDPEPGTWQIEETDTYGSGGGLGGRFMLRQYGGSTHTFDDLTITDLSGIEAPKAARWPYPGGGYETSFSESGDMTMGGWFRISTVTGSNNTFFSVDDGGSNFWNVLTEAGSTQLKLARNGSATYDTGIFLTLDVWHHISAVYVASTGVTTLRVLPLGGSTTTAASPSGVGPSGVSLRLAYSFSLGINGDVANFKVWEAALSTGEVATEAAHYEAQRTSGLWGAWSFYDGSTTIELPDSSGNGRTLFGTSSSATHPYTTAGPAGIIL